MARSIDKSARAGDKQGGIEEMILLKGRPALSRFRSEALFRRITEVAPTLGVLEVRTAFIYIVGCSRELSAEGLDRCFTLLEAVDVIRRIPGGFVVVPRKGTISPWCSKATDIFRNCGMTAVTRVERGVLYQLAGPNGRITQLAEASPVLDLLRDRMTEGAYEDVSDIFSHRVPRALGAIDVMGGGIAALEEANVAMGLALSRDEIAYFHKACLGMGRNPTDAELVMFGQVNSEHCRHKIFKAEWIIDGERKDMSLFEMIQNTHKRHPGGTLSAYCDNAAVIKGFKVPFLEANRDASGRYAFEEADLAIVAKVETHNHPTAICPYPGAATGVGGEIRDEAATGIGSRSRAGLSGFAVSNLRVPGYIMPWEQEFAEFPRRLATPLQIMIEGPIGGARFGNEFGRPQLCGFFRTYEQRTPTGYRGYHKPIMLAGGMGMIRREHAQKCSITAGAHIIQIGGPAMRIGLGGGAASSMGVGSNEEQLDFDSVQRDNAEVQRRCQGVIDTCIAMKDRNPILSIHDLGAGGLSNGCPELVAETGGEFWLRKVHNEEPSMSPMEIWCCEAQERYVLAVRPAGLKKFLAACERERCPVAVIGRATNDGRLVLRDDLFGNSPIDIELGVILGKIPRTLRDVQRVLPAPQALVFEGETVRTAAERVLRMPAVANKTFLITIADRTVTGMTARDQMTGAFQVPISDVAVSLLSYEAFSGSAMAIGERPAVALSSGPASARMAVGEALTNICAADIGAIGNVKLSANWMCACGEEGEDASLFDAVRAVGMEFCPALGVSIPVGKDSLSMRTSWKTSGGTAEKVIAPMSLIVSAFGPVSDVRRTVTADLKQMLASKLILIDLGRGRNRLGGSSLAQAFNQAGGECPDADSAVELAAFFKCVQELVRRELLLTYHDRSDGGLFTTLFEMAYGGRVGLRVTLEGPAEEHLAAVFSEELGAVIQVADGCMESVEKVLKKHGMSPLSRIIGAPSDDGRMTLVSGVGMEFREVYSERVSVLGRTWSELTNRMQTLRDNPECAAEEFDNLLDENDPGMNFHLTWNPDDPVTLGRTRPRLAILREQGVNGHIEMAAAFAAAGFEAVDVHMTDLHSGRQDLARFTGLVACGGFSYGDVLGAGAGWARTILFNPDLKRMFKAFFARQGTFGLGVCNGCQMMSQLKEIIPGTSHWPEFARNRSEQFEARFVTVEILKSPSIFFAGMEGSRIPVPVAHGEGRADFSRTGSLDDLAREGLVAARYVDNRGKATERYPFNPNGSPDGLTAVTSADGRVTIMMPHPERAFRRVQLSYWPSGVAGEAGPWLRMFQNARAFTR